LDVLLLKKGREINANIARSVLVEKRKNLREFTKSSHVHTRSSEFIDMPACNKHRKSRDSLVILTKGIKVGRRRGRRRVRTLFKYDALFTAELPQLAHNSTHTHSSRSHY